jgi:hypothetical protein
MVFPLFPFQHPAGPLFLLDEMVRQEVMLRTLIVMCLEILVAWGITEICHDL